MPAFGDRQGVLAEVLDTGAGHLELAHLALDRHHHRRRVDRERGGHQVAVEEVVEVLVGGDACHHLVSGGVVQGLARVAVRDPRRQFLQGDVGQAVRCARAGSGPRRSVTWAMRSRSSATGSTDRVTVR